MPSTMTHTYFAKDVYDTLPKHYQKKVQNKLEYLKLFAQGSDPFMFYHFLIGKKAKEIAKIQKIMHQTKTQDFFLNTISYIKKKHLTNNQEVMAYLYGYICHYTLDCQVHPFIYYKSGIFNSHKPDTYRYNGMHQKQEYLIDLWYIHQKEQIEPAKFKVHNHIFNVKNFSTDLKLTITNSIEKTYNLKNINPTYLKSIRYMKLFFRLANYDPIGFKKLLYTLLDHLTPKYVINVSELSFHVSSKNTTTYLNLEHKPWHYPWSKTETFTTSIKDLYEIALKKATTTIIEVTDLLEKNQLNKEKIKQIFPNLSFSTGRNCEEKLEMKYFEY